jgi:hypothetical protein
MTNAYRQYCSLVDQLRELRRGRTSEGALRAILQNLEDLFPTLAQGEQDVANQEGWRGWPDLYDARMDQPREVDPEA